MRLRWLFATVLLATVTISRSHAQELLQSPDQFLGYRIGSRFTPHHRVIDYVRHLASASSRVRMEAYGESSEGRPLIATYVSAPENLARLDEIRLNNLRLTGMEPGSARTDLPAIVWLSYNVHGNEPSSTEASLLTLHQLAVPATDSVEAWLKDVVVVIDPCLNPDGRERYVSWYHQSVGSRPDPARDSREHQEPWPGGRGNHYYFDLNRDWAWQTQQETQARVALYRRWMPQVHADFHEQGMDSPYFFAPAAEPMHERITSWQRSFQTTVGRHHAKLFDRMGWLYFTRESFDLLFPGFGDTWPTFSGSIGLTYEQGGHAAAGLSVITSVGDTLTLSERVRHHVATGLSTVQLASWNRERLVREFKAYFENARSGGGARHKAYLVRADHGGERLQRLARYLLQQGIQVGYAAGEAPARGRGYWTSGDTAVVVKPGDLIVPMAQPQSTLLSVLFERHTALTDSMTYDDTAWALPYAFGLDAYALDTEPRTPLRKEAPAHSTLSLPARPYAYLLNWQGFNDLRFLAALLQEGFHVRHAEAPFETSGGSFGRGTLIIARAGNERSGELFDGRIRQLAETYGRRLTGVQSGMVVKGYDLGSSSIHHIASPRVAMLAGDRISSAGAGEVWHYFDRELEYPLSLLDVDHFRAEQLAGFDVLILPSGDYGRVLDADGLESLKRWVQQGGKVIAVGGALRAFAGQEGFGLKARKAETDTTQNLLRTYESRRRTYLEEDIPGSIFRVHLDTSHPLAYGSDARYASLKRGDQAYEYLETGWNVGVIPTSPLLSGFAGHRALPRIEQSLVFGVQEIGKGSIIYMVDDPLVRGFWEAGKLLFGNAVFLVKPG